MRKKLHAAPEVQSLVNAVMPWAEARLKEQGTFGPIAAWLPIDGPKSVRLESDVVLEMNGSAGTCGASPAMDGGLSFSAQEARLARDLRIRWQRGELAAAALVAQVLYGPAGSSERSMAVRLHIETHAGYCADILMPYRIRAAGRWRDVVGRGTSPAGSRTARNRVHFTHPVAQESDPLLSQVPVPAEE